MDRRGEGRRIGQVHGVKVADLQPRRNADDGNVGHLVYGATAQDLHTQKLSRVFIGDELCDEGGGIGIVVGLVVRDAHGGDHFTARFHCLLLREARSAGAEGVREPDDTGAQAACVGAGRAGQGLSQASGGEVGRGAHGGPLGRAGDAVSDKGAVAGGVDVVQAGLLVFVDHDGAPVHLNARACQEGGGGPHADAQNHQVGSQLTGARRHGADGALAPYGGDGDAGQELHAALAQLPCRKARHLGVQDPRKDLREHIDDGHRQLPGRQVLGHLHADEACAHHDGLFAVVLLDVVPNGDGVVGGADGENALEADALEVGNDGCGTGGDNQFVIADSLRGAVGAAEGDGLCRRVHADGFPAGVDRRAGQRGEFFRGVDDQLLPGRNVPADKIRQAATGVGNVGAFRIDLHLGRAVLPLELGRRLCPRGNAANDDDFHANSLALYFM